MDKLTEVFCKVDDFVKDFSARFPGPLLTGPKRQRNRKTRLSLSEMMTILVMFHDSNYRTFKHYYQRHVQAHWGGAFPGLLSYTRFLELMPRTLLPLIACLHSRYGTCTGISFIDSTKLQVCHNKRIRRNKVFDGVGAVGKTTTGWFFGMKLHLVINDRGELLSVTVTQGNIDDRSKVEDLTRHLVGKLYGDKGYISTKLFDNLYQRGLHLVTHVRSNMKNRLMPWMDKILLRKRSLIETVNDQLKNVCQVEHSRHRSPLNAMINLLTGLINYTFLPKKPSLNLEACPIGKTRTLVV